MVELALLLFFIDLYCSSMNEALAFGIAANSVVRFALYHATDNIAMSLFAIYPEDLDPSYSQTAGAVNRTRIRQVYSRPWLHVEL